MGYSIKIIPRFCEGFFWLFELIFCFYQADGQNTGTKDGDDYREGDDKWRDGWNGDN